LPRALWGAHAATACADCLDQSYDITPANAASIGIYGGEVFFDYPIGEDLIIQGDEL
jgi:hypothetical protein